MAWHDLTHAGEAEVMLLSTLLKSENSCFPSQVQISTNYSMQNGVASTGKNWDNKLFWNKEDSLPKQAIYLHME